MRRALLTLATLFAVSVIAFALVRLVPGDTVTALLGPQYTERDAAILREQYGVDRSTVEQYVLWLRHLARGDLGQSSFTRTSVVAAIGERLPVTIELAALSVAIAVAVGLPLGVAAAVLRDRWTGRLAGALGVTFVSVPAFWLGTLLVIVFALGLRWVPSGGFVPLTVDPVANARHMLLPSLALGGAVAGVVLRTTRSAMLEVLAQDYIRVARAKGVSRAALLFRHALPTALSPIVTAVGVQAGYLLAGSIVIEQVFSLPGLGRLTFQALGNRDYPLFQATVLFLAVSYVLVTLAVDLLIVRLDPRLR